MQRFYQAISLLIGLGAISSTSACTKYVQWKARIIQRDIAEQCNLKPHNIIVMGGNGIPFHIMFATRWDNYLRNNPKLYAERSKCIEILARQYEAGYTDHDPFENGIQ